MLGLVSHVGRDVDVGLPMSLSDVDGIGDETYFCGPMSLTDVGRTMPTSGPTSVEHQPMTVTDVGASKAARSMWVTVVDELGLTSVPTSVPHQPMSVADVGRLLRMLQGRWRFPRREVLRTLNSHCKGSLHGEQPLKGCCTC